MERRFTDRVPTEVGVACRVPASPERALLVDLSRSGCRLEFGRHNIDAGATVNLDFRTGKPVGGEVVWTDGAFAGVRFHSSLPKPIAIEFGLEPADLQSPQCDDAQLESGRPADSGGLLRHWVRRLTDVFA
ncbi:MAG: PilZ domain-containing protein [Croceibacterium sp.]